MKGAIFISLGNFVEENFGIDVWNSFLDKLDSPNNGVYLSIENYPDEELFALVGIAAEALDLPAEKVVQTFGKYLFGQLAAKHPVFIQEGMSLKEFLISIETVIHVEVKKAYATNSLPEFDYEDLADNQLVMKYTSERKLCHLAEGLIEGAAERFNEPVEIKHPVCMHDGHDHCRLEVTIG